MTNKIIKAVCLGLVVTFSLGSCNQRTVARLDSEIESLKIENKSLKERIHELEDQNEDLESRIDDLEREVDDIMTFMSNELDY